VVWESGFHAPGIVARRSLTPDEVAAGGAPVVITPRHPITMMMSYPAKPKEKDLLGEFPSRFSSPLLDLLFLRPQNRRLGLLRPTLSASPFWTMVFFGNFCPDSSALAPAPKEGRRNRWCVI